MERIRLLRVYDALKASAQKALLAPENAALIDTVYTESLRTIVNLDREPLKSLVDDKRYFAFRRGRKLSRAINEGLFVPDHAEWLALREAMRREDLGGFTSARINRILYTMAISFCAAIDLVKDGDQKTPGTFFEYFVAHFFAWRVGVEPTTAIQILSVDGEDTKLRTDFVFNLGPKQRKFHMPIKTSTRERSIMLWAHQRLLDGIYGAERFMGTPVLLAETKTDNKRKEVVEICLPDQWRVYQLYIAKLKRVYYLDMPSAYRKLNDEFPPLSVRPFADFFFEWADLTPA